MTFKELDSSLKAGVYDDKEQKKLELVLKASATLTSSIRNLLVNSNILREETERFLNHKKFKDAMLTTIMDILEEKNCAHHLRRSELQTLITDNTTIIEYKDVLNKIHEGIMHCICKKVNEGKDLETILMVQEVLSTYNDAVHKTTIKKTTF